MKEIEDALLAPRSILPSTAARNCGSTPRVSPSERRCRAKTPGRRCVNPPTAPGCPPPLTLIRGSFGEASPKRAESREGGRRRADALTQAVTFDELAARLGSSPRIGTSSVRRIAQLARLFPGAQFLPIRGNLDTRLRKLDEGGYDALVLASAGLVRLGHRARISAALPIPTCVPAPGQGIIAIETRAADGRMMSRVAAIDDHTSHAALDAERTVVTRLGGGCQMPIGAYAEVSGGALTLAAIVLSLDGAQVLRAESRGPMSEANAVGSAVADDLLAQGAAGILADIERAHAAVEGLQP